MKNRAFTAIITNILLLSLPLSSSAYDDRYVHPAINYNAAWQSVLVTENVLSKLGFSRGLDSEVQGKKIFRWIEEGGTDEDYRNRPLWHFHDPLKSSWSAAGILGSYDSSLVWAQRSYQPAFGTYSWPTARESYYQALVTGNEEHFAQAFLTLGHLMHLVADMAVPAHTRNDLHPLDPDEPPWSIIPAALWPASWHTDPYEKWAAKKNIYQVLDYNARLITAESNYMSIISHYVSTGPDHDLAPIPISAFWDQNIYQGMTPDPALTWSANVGLAEFTNANFYSKNTMYGSGYPHPTVLSTYIDWNHPESIIAEDGKQDTPLYVKRIVNGVPKYRLGAMYYLAYDVGGSNLALFNMTLDEKVFEDYAKELIPRAVGYSAGLLDYFFRGELKVTAMPALSGGNVVGVSLNVVNSTSTQETISAGAFALSVRYTPAGANPDHSEDVFVKASATSPSGVIPYNQASNLYFTLYTPIPLECLDSATATLAFRGTLGTESDAVIGKVFPLGSILFDEEWNTAPYGDNAWQHAYRSDAHGYYQNTVSSGFLHKQLVSFKSNNTWGENTSMYVFPNGGLPISENTYVNFNIPDMSINDLNAPAWQDLFLGFSNGLNIYLYQSSGKNERNYIGTRDCTAYYTFTPGANINSNLIDLLLDYAPYYHNCNIDFNQLPEPLTLQHIIFDQVFDAQGYPGTNDIIQNMNVDFMRIFNFGPVNNQ